MAYRVPSEQQEFHQKYGGSVRWRLTEQGLEVEGSGIERSPGAPTTVITVWETYHEPINRYAEQYGVPVELIVATICTESSGNPAAIRLEPGYVSDESTPGKVSPGIMQTLIKTAKSSLSARGVDPDTIDREWLFVAENSINAGTSYIQDLSNDTNYDPILVGAAYNAGGLYQNTSPANRWRLRMYPIGTSEHCDRFLRWFNDFWAVLGTHAIRPVISLYEYFHQAPCVFPVDIGSGTGFTSENLERYYKHTEVEHTGGYFPLGANSIWHGGIHLRASEGSPVYAYSDGEMVAGRLGAEGTGSYGSTNFILLRHEVTGALLNEAAAKSAERRFVGFRVKTPWLNLRPSAGTSQDPIGKLANGDEVGILDTTAQDAGGYTWMKVRVNTAQDTTQVGKEGWIAITNLVERLYAEPEQVFDPAARKTYYSLYMHLGAEQLDANNTRLARVPWIQAEHLKVTANKLNLRISPNGAVVASLGEGDKLAQLDNSVVFQGGHEWLHVEVLEAKDNANKGRAGYVAKGSNFVEPLLEPDQRVLEQFKSGEIVKMSRPVHSGDVLWTVGQYGSPGYRASMIHWEIFSEENLLPKFDTAEDTDEDFNIDCKRLLDMVEQHFFGSNEVLDIEEIADFYKQSADAQNLRRWACRFTSEWGVNLDVGVSNLKGRWWTRGLKERLKPYTWWQDAVAKAVELPSSPKVWHYNPLTFMDMVGTFSVRPPAHGADSTSAPAATSEAEPGTDSSTASEAESGADPMPAPFVETPSE